VHREVRLVTVLHCATDLVRDVPDVLFVHLVLGHDAVSTDVRPELGENETDATFFFS
jgi:hypothetical protein